MVRHASSHGFSVFMCTVIASFLVEFLKPLIPNLMNRIRNISYYLIDMLSIPLTVDFLTVVIVAAVLGLFWGIFFKLQYVDK